jgi:hypothetical protein
VDIDQPSDGMSPSDSASAAHQQFVPPHAPVSRRVPEDPISFAERLLADESSALADAEAWDFYAQLDDEVALAAARLTVTDRLLAARGTQVILEVAAPVESAVVVLRGELTEVGRGWCALSVRGRVVIVNLERLESLGGFGGEQLPSYSRDSRTARNWAAVVRDLAGPGKTVKVQRTSGRALEGSVILAASDHFDVSLNHSTSGRAVVAIPYSGVSHISAS